MIERAARFLIVEGVVQGVGFRPFVYRLATRYGLAGWVRNAGTGVEALVEGGNVQIDAFLAALVAAPPPLASITDVRVAEEPAADIHTFAIVASRSSAGIQPIPADVALCSDCRRELDDPADRRYRYPLINCTNCGPRYSIVNAMPYDRAHTAMQTFDMCTACRAEYVDPLSRRFHAEPIACHECGPQLEVVERNGRQSGEAALARARRLLTNGAIVALKGVGGYHLACDARNSDAVERLRRWKRRGEKPLAIMVRDHTELLHVARVNDAELRLMESSAHPIVLVEQHSRSSVAGAINPGSSTIGVMFAYTGLHRLLIGAESDVPAPAALVMTSANRSAEPTITSDELALRTLVDIADAVLMHDRAIVTRVDDSVSQIIDGVEAPLRRARGYAPLPMKLPFPVRPLLACGADMKSTFCLATGTQVVLSSYVGDLENYDVHCEYSTMIERLCTLWRIEPEVVCHDLHPGYWSRRFAERAYPDLRRLAIQHHHAHVASCMAEHGLNGSVIGIAFDGTGYGDDGRVWGGEFLVADYAAYERAAHFDYVPMYGGELAIRETWRMALAYLRAAEIEWDERLAPVRVPGPAQRQVVAVQAGAYFTAPLTSSVGRLFDAVASLLDLRHVVTYDAQAAIELEALADAGACAPYDFLIAEGEPWRVDVRPTIRAIVDDRDRGTSAATIAARFHATLVAIIVHVCSRLRTERGLNDVVLTGGVFQNRKLASSAARALASRHFAVYRHRAVPANDGGISYGQAAIASARLRSALR